MLCFWFDEARLVWSRGTLTAGRGLDAPPTHAAVYASRGHIIPPHECIPLRVLVEHFNEDDIKLLQLAHNSGYRCLIISTPPGGLKPV